MSLDTGLGLGIASWLSNVSEVCLICELCRSCDVGLALLAVQFWALGKSFAWCVYTCVSARIRLLAFLFLPYPIDVPARKGRNCSWSKLDVLL